MYYKILKENLTHHGFRYNFGLNIDTIPFNPSGSCESGGLYYTTKEHIADFLYIGELIADVVIPEGARTYKDPQGDKWKADKIIITKIARTKDCELFTDHEIMLKAVRKNGNIIRHCKEQTEELCIEAVKQNGCSLIFIKKQTPRICLEAVKQDGYAIYLVRNKTEELCLEAVKQNGLALQFVKEHQTYEICMEAVKQNGLALYHVKNNTKEICSEAVKQDGRAYKYTK